MIKEQEAEMIEILGAAPTQGAERMTTHEFNNNSNQAERRRVERDTYLTRAQSDADLTASGAVHRKINLNSNYRRPSLTRHYQHRRLGLRSFDQ